MRRKTRLEEELIRMRSRLEQGVMAEQSFTSNAAIRLSQRMDRKINEYHDFMKRHYYQS